MHPHSPIPLLFPHISDRPLASLGLVLTLPKLHLGQLKRQSTVLLTNPRARNCDQYGRQCDQHFVLGDQISGLVAKMATTFLCVADE